MSEAKQNLDKAAREFEQWAKDQLHTPASPPAEQGVCNCGMGHRDQVERYPVGVTVKAIAPVPQGSKDYVPTGTSGRVTGHCDDGRAWFRFEHEPQSGHTFHFPEQWVTVEHEQPAPEGEGESVEQAVKRITKGCSNWSDIEYRIKPRLTALLNARQSDHRLAALVPGLVEALRNESLPRPDGDCWCDDNYRKEKPHTDHCLRTKELLNTVAKEREKEG